MDTLTPKRLVEQGQHRSALYRAVRQGSLERIGRGLYRDVRAPAADLNWIEAAARRDDATICLVSALAHYDLTDAIPDALDIAIPRGARKPVTDSAIRWHSFDQATFSLGHERTLIPGSELSIGIYSPERTIVDTFRLRGSLGYELSRDALRTWLRRGGAPAELLRIATRVPRCEGPLRQALEMLT